MKRSIHTFTAATCFVVWEEQAADVVVSHWESRTPYKWIRAPPFMADLAFLHCRLLSSRIGELHALAEALMDRETLTGEEIREVFAAERQRRGSWPWRLLGVRGRRGWGGKESVMTELDGRMKSLETQVMPQGRRGLGSIGPRVWGVWEDLQKLRDVGNVTLNMPKTKGNKPHQCILQAHEAVNLRHGAEPHTP